MDKKIIELQVKELSKEKYTKEQVLNELANVMEYTLSKNGRQLVKNNKLDKNYKRLYIAFCDFLQQEGRDIICYTRKLGKNHLLKKYSKDGYVFYPEITK